MHASDTDLTITVIATDGLAVGEVVCRATRRIYLRL